MPPAVDPLASAPPPPLERQRCGTSDGSRPRDVPRQQWWEQRPASAGFVAPARLLPTVSRTVWVETQGGTRFETGHRLKGTATASRGICEHVRELITLQPSLPVCSVLRCSAISTRREHSRGQLVSDGARWNVIFTMFVLSLPTGQRRADVNAPGEGITKFFLQIGRAVLRRRIWCGENRMAST